jgi:MerR family transcriptional regulator, light-induced transcriptional regulator
MYTIKQAAGMVGVEPSSLRAWEQRYGVVSPRRSSGGYRVYDDSDVARLRSMAGLIQSGWSAAQAAERAKGEQMPVASMAMTTELGPEVLVRCAEDFDAQLLTRALDQAFAHSSFEHVVAEWLLPGLAALGRGWVEGRVTIAGEHFVTAAVQRRVGSAYEAAGNPVAGPLVLIGLPPDSRHELGVLIYATLLRRLGVRTRYVGGDLPVGDWLLAVRTIEPSAVVLAAPMDVDVHGVEQTVRVITGHRRELPVFVGGASQDSVEGATRLGHDMLEAARQLTRRLQGLPVTAA